MVFYYFWGVDVRMLGFSVVGVEVWNGLEAEVEEGEIDTLGANTVLRTRISAAFRAYLLCIYAECLSIL